MSQCLDIRRARDHLHPRRLLFRHRGRHRRLARPADGGANEAAMALIASFGGADEAEQGILERLARKELIMGFGHRVYKRRDPRSPIIKEWARRLGEEARDTEHYAVAERIEAVMRREKRLFPNLDFYSALVYRACGIRRRVYADFCHRPQRRVGGPYHRATARQPAHPAAGRVCRSRAASLRSAPRAAIQGSEHRHARPGSVAGYHRRLRYRSRARQ